MNSLSTKNNINIVHIVCGYEKKKLYKNLFNNLSHLGINQKVVAPYFNNILLEGDEKYDVIPFKRDSSFIKRLLFFYRTHKLLYFIQKNIQFDNTIIHAHSLYSDGAVAYLLNKKYGIPYIVAVRNTDINIYYKYFFYLRKLGLDILNNADNIVFLSHAYKYNVLNNIVPNNLTSIHSKSIVCPNGIEDFWFRNKQKKNIDFTRTVKLVYIGEFQPNKNIHSIVEAVNILNKQGRNISFTAFGKGRNDNVKYTNELLKLESKTFIVEKNLNQQDFISIFKDYDIFIMPSFTETFGLVYVEALTQGLSIIYSEKQGFDGFFKDGEVGYSVNPYDVNDIVKKIISIINNYKNIANNIANINLDIFKWENIAKSYNRIYKSI